MRFLKRIIAYTSAFLIALSAFGVVSFADGKKAVSSFEELCNIKNDLNGSYYLTADIDASGKSLETIGSAAKQFKGTLDGGGHTVKGLTVTPVKTEKGYSAFCALFAYNAGTVKDIKFEDIKVEVKDNRYSYAGAVAAINLGDIENCYVSGSITNTNVEIAAYTGGICGESLRGSIKNSVSYANVYSSGGEQYTGGIMGYCEKGDYSSVASYGSLFTNGIAATMDSYCGGIVGLSQSGGVFKNTHFAGGIISEKHANVYMGGFAGTVKGEVSRFLCTGTVMPSEIISHIFIGGVAGDDASAKVGSAYYVDYSIKEELTGRFGTALTAEKLNEKQSFSGFDFTNTWRMGKVSPELSSLPKAPANDPIAVLTGIEITKKPKKLKYTQGDQALDLTGLEVSAVYSGKKVKLSQSDYSVGGYNYVLVGKQTITVSYKGFMASFQIEVAKLDKAIIPSVVISDHSYQKGNSNGKPGSKKESDGTKSVDSSSVSTSSVTAPSGSITAGKGGNTVIDTLDGDTESDSSKVVSSDVDSSGKKKALPAVIIGAVVVLALAAAVIIAFVITRLNSGKNKSATSENGTADSHIADCENAGDATVNDSASDDDNADDVVSDDGADTDK